MLKKQHQQKVLILQKNLPQQKGQQQKKHRLMRQKQKEHQKEKETGLKPFFTGVQLRRVCA